MIWKWKVALPSAGKQPLEIKDLLELLATLNSIASHSVVSVKEAATASEDSGEPSNDTSDPKDKSS